jgi:hypothetical protein
MISTISFPSSHLSWLFNVVFMAHFNSCNTKCMVDFSTAKNQNDENIEPCEPTYISCNPCEYSVTLLIKTLYLSFPSKA